MWYCFLLFKHINIVIESIVKYIFTLLLYSFHILVLNIKYYIRPKYILYTLENNKVFDMDIIIIYVKKEIDVSSVSIWDTVDNSTSHVDLHSGTPRVN